MNQRKPTLGRGLADLLGTPTRAAPSPAPIQATVSVPPPAAGETLTRLPLDVLQRGKYQPRLDMRPESLQELADSIRAQGVVQPIVVRPLQSEPGGSRRYEIIAGERRWRAAQMANLSEIPAVVRDIPDESAIAVALIENIQRENLNPLEEARALQRLISEFELTHAQAAEAVGRSRAAVSNLLRLLELVPEVAELVEKRQLEMGHARALLAASDRRLQLQLARQVVAGGLSVRETEGLIRQGHARKPPAALDRRPAGDPNVARLEQELAEKLGAQVEIRHGTGGKGSLVVNYNSLDELDGILAHIH